MFKLKLLVEESIKIVFIIVLFVSLLNQAHAARIYGSIYDLSLDKVHNSVVEINTTPRQRFVAVNGTYDFEVSSGRYRLNAVYQERTVQMYGEENITVTENGEYIIDLFLYPNFDEDLYNDLDIQIEPPYSDSKPTYFWLLVPLAALMFLFLILIIRINTGLIRKEIQTEIKDMENDLTKVINVLKKHSGRASQKEIRKNLPMSEAKISLLIAELESLGKIKKIKKGRGNIIILEK
jgi:uncharacterized membrane protein